MCLEYFKNPNQFVEKVKEGNMTEKSVGVLAIASALFSVNTVIAVHILKSMHVEITAIEIVNYVLALGYEPMALLAFITVFLGGMFFSWVFQKVMNSLGAEGGFYEGVSSIAYPILLVSIGALITLAASFLPTYAGNLVGFVAIALTFSVAYASWFNFTKQLFETDMITAFIGISVTMAIVVLSIYGSLATTAEGLMMIL